MGSSVVWAAEPEIETKVGDNGVVLERAWATVSTRIRTHEDPLRGEFRIVHREQGRPLEIYVQELETPAHSVLDVTTSVRFGMGFFETLEAQLERSEGMVSKDIEWKCQARVGESSDDLSVAELERYRREFVSKWPVRRPWQWSVVFAVLYPLGLLGFLSRFRRTSSWSSRVVWGSFLLVLIAASLGFGFQDAKENHVDRQKIVLPSGQEDILWSIYFGQSSSIEISAAAGNRIEVLGGESVSRAIGEVRYYTGTGRTVLSPRKGSGYAYLLERPG